MGNRHALARAMAALVLGAGMVTAVTALQDTAGAADPPTATIRPIPLFNPRAINDAGVVYARGGPDGTWNELDGLGELPIPGGAFGASVTAASHTAPDTVVGRVVLGQVQPVMWNDRTPSLLDTSGWDGGQVFDVNRHSEAVGEVFRIPQGGGRIDFEAVRWLGPGGFPAPIGGLASAFAISENGKIAGSIEIRPPPGAVFRPARKEGASVTELPRLAAPPGGDASSRMSDINDDGDIVGTTTLTEPDANGNQRFVERRGTLWTGGSVADLGANFTPNAINDLGFIVGRAPNGDGVVWFPGDPGNPRRLIDIVPPEEGWAELQEAFDINDSCQIVGTGLVDTGGPFPSLSGYVVTLDECTRAGLVVTIEVSEQTDRITATVIVGNDSQSLIDEITFVGNPLEFSEEDILKIEAGLTEPPEPFSLGPHEEVAFEFVLEPLAGGTVTLTSDVTGVKPGGTPTFADASLEVDVVDPAVVVNQDFDFRDSDIGDGVCDSDLSEDGNQCTLRAAIQEVNASPQISVIEFDVPGGGVVVDHELPAIEVPVTIDGFTQPDFGYVAIDGSGTGFTVDGLTLLGGDSTVRGVAIGGFGGFGLVLRDGDANEVWKSVIGEFTERALTGNGRGGVLIERSADNIVGDDTIAVVLQGHDVTAAATRQEPGGDDSACGFPCNMIVGNGGPGVTVLRSTSDGNLISLNEIHGNDGLAIDLDGDGPTPNDLRDRDLGPNNLVNFPSGVVVQEIGDDVHVFGMLDVARVQLDNGAPKGTVELVGSSSLALGQWGQAETLLNDEFEFIRPAFAGREPFATFRFPLTTRPRFVAALYHTKEGTSEISMACTDPDGNGSTDNDRDDLCDGWETSGIDFDGDGSADLTLDGADPNRPDVYVEADFMAGNRPLPAAISAVVDAFADAPGGPIALHVDVDEEAPTVEFVANGPVWTSDDELAEIKYGLFADVCDGTFGTPEQRASANCHNAIGAKWLAYRYALFALLSPDGASGFGEQAGNDFVVFDPEQNFDHWFNPSDDFDAKARAMGRSVGSQIEVDQSETFMHELGHTLGLAHGGSDEVNCKPNYQSVMNYQYSRSSRGRRVERAFVAGSATPDLGALFASPLVVLDAELDYSRHGHNDLDPNHLDEHAGVRGRAGGEVLYALSSPADTPAERFVQGIRLIGPSNGPIDWFLDGTLESDVAAAIDSILDPSCRQPGESLEGLLPAGDVPVLHAHDDWSSLVFSPRHVSDRVGLLAAQDPHTVFDQANRAFPDRLLGPPPTDRDAVGLVNPETGHWYLRRSDGDAHLFTYGNPGDVPFLGDWDCDGVDTPGLFRQSDGYVYLRNSNTTGIAHVHYFFGNPGDVPLAGDFDGDGCDTVSLYRPGESRVYVIDRLGSDQRGLGAADFFYSLGDAGDRPFAADVDGDGRDEVSVYRPSTARVHERHELRHGAADRTYSYAEVGDVVFGGDWDGDGTASPGAFRPGEARFFLRNANSAGPPHEVFSFGEPGWAPVVGAVGNG